LLHTKQFLDKYELDYLTKIILRNYEPTNNSIHLEDADEIIKKVKNSIEEYNGCEVEYLTSYFFLACSTTMDRFESNGGWHTDATCRAIEGDCYNAWIPIYVDSTNTGLEIIETLSNEGFYENLGDLTEPLTVYSRKSSEILFDAVRVNKNLYFMAVNKFSGKVLPFSDESVNSTKILDPSAGDIVVFKQSELHRGIHDNGVRLQLSLKFFDKKCSLNKKATNQDYMLFKNFIQSDSILEFLKAKSLISGSRLLSKHGRLEKELVHALLRK